jgi:hypothetical protein
MTGKLVWEDHRWQWVAKAGESLVGTATPFADIFLWDFCAGVSGPIRRGRAATLADAQAAVEAAWSAWLDAAGLVPKGRTPMTGKSPKTGVRLTPTEIGLLHAAIQDAIGWQAGLVDAYRHMPTDPGFTDAKASIKAYRALSAKLFGEPRAKFGCLVDGSRLASIDELREGALASASGAVIASHAATATGAAGGAGGAVGNGSGTATVNGAVNGPDRVTGEAG